MKRVPALGLVLLKLLFARSLSHAETLPRESPERLGAVLEVLKRSSTGRGLIDSARTLWKVDSDRGLLEFLRWGRASRTDAVLIRHFNPATGSEEREREVSISLRSFQRIDEAVLDLAHELSHAVSKPIWDPYDPKLTAGDYIFSSLEGPGGEVDAVVTECRVALELSALADAIDSSRCRPYLSASGGVDRESVRADFYRVGNWRKKLVARLGEEARRFPLLSPKPAKLFSSTGHAPYPVSLLEEFEQINSAACENSRIRLRSFAARAPAGGSSGAGSERSVRDFLRLRCR